MVSPLWPCVMRGMLLCSSANLNPYSTMDMSCGVLFGHSKAANALRTSSMTAALAGSSHHSLSGVIFWLPSAGISAPMMLTICEPADMPALFSIARVAAFTTFCGVLTCSATPTPAQCPARRRQLNTRYGRLSDSSTGRMARTTRSFTSVTTACTSSTPSGSSSAWSPLAASNAARAILPVKCHTSNCFLCCGSCGLPCSRLTLLGPSLMTSMMAGLIQPGPLRPASSAASIRSYSKAWPPRWMSSPQPGAG